MVNSKQVLPNNPLRGRSLAITLLIVALWGGNSVAVSFSIDALPPVAVACARFAMGMLVMLVWCVLQRVPLSPTRWETWVSFVAGFLLFAQISTFNVAVGWTNSTHGAMLINTFPFFVAGMEHWITKTDRLTSRRIVGMCLAAIGVAAVMLDTGVATNGNATHSFLAGDLLLLASSLLLAIRVVYVGRVVQKMAPSKLIFWHDVFGVLMFAVWSFSTESLAEVHMTWPAFWGLFYQGVIIAGFCFVIHASLLRHHSASQISVFSFATPIFGVIFSVLLRSEPFTLAIAIGAVCVALGIWAVTYE